MMRYLNRLNLHIGKLGEASTKHRSAILFLSLLVILIEPGVKLTFGSASLLGLGISVSPPQEISIAVFVLALLAYRMLAFWIVVLLESGVDMKRAERKALLEFDPAWEAEAYQPGNMDQLIRQESHAMVLKWTVRRIVWEVLFPNLFAIMALAIFATKYTL